MCPGVHLSQTLRTTALLEPHRAILSGDREAWSSRIGRSAGCVAPHLSRYISLGTEMQNQYGMNVLNHVQCQSAGWTPTPGHVKGDAEPKVFLGADLHRQID